MGKLVRDRIPEIIKADGKEPITRILCEEEYLQELDVKLNASIEDRLNYKDKFLEPSIFQWECENNISAKDLQALRVCKYVHLFVRKVQNEHGIQLPFTYVGEGRFTNERAQTKKWNLFIRYSNEM